MTKAPQKSNNNKRRVHWGGHSKIQYEEGKKTLSSSSSSSSSSDGSTYRKWYGAAEIQSFKDERKIAMKLANEFGKEAVETSGRATCRGVEHLESKKLLKEKCQRQHLAVQVVLDACVNYQSLTAEKREQMIAIQYQSVSLHCKKVAHERARAYWEETQKTLDSDKQCVLSPHPSSAIPRRPSKSRGLRAFLKGLPVM